MKKPSVLVSLLKLLAAIILGWFLWVCIFSACTPAEVEETIEPFTGASLVFGVLTGLAIFLGMTYNSLAKQSQQVKAAYSDITVYEQRANRLLDKANRVADKYMQHEATVQINIAHARSGPPLPKKTKRIRTSTQFQSELENYPELKANESIAALLDQIRECENGFASAKLSYNQIAVDYNTLLHSFPSNILKRIGHFDDAAYYRDITEDALISDDALGI